MKDLDKIFPGFSRIQNHLKKTTSKKPCSLIKDHSSPKVKKINTKMVTRGAPREGARLCASLCSSHMQR
jgi:hypothetical protein